MIITIINIKYASSKVVVRSFCLSVFQSSGVSERSKSICAQFFVVVVYPKYNRYTPIQNQPAETAKQKDFRRIWAETVSEGVGGSKAMCPK
jgi:hypothetical protein